MKKPLLKKVSMLAALFVTTTVSMSFTQGDQVLLPHSSDCSKYYLCVQGMAIEMSCPEGLHFNPELEVCDWPHRAGCDIEPGFPSYSGTPDCPLLGDEDRDVCPPQYDIIKDTWTEVTLSYRVEGNANYRFIAEVTVGGSVQYRYEVKSVQRIQTERVFCPGYWGICTIKTCGQQI